MLFFPQLTPEKKKQLSFLLLISIGLIILIWALWLTKFGYSRKEKNSSEFFNFFQLSGQETIDQYNQFKDQLQATWQQVESTVNQTQKQEKIIDQMKQRLATATTTSSTTSSTQIQVDQSPVESINQSEE